MEKEFALMMGRDLALLIPEIIILLTVVLR